MSDANIHIIGNAQAVDPVAIDQLHQTARLPGIDRVVGLPDLHAGRGIAVGAAFWSPDRLFPYLVGSDIGCGMGLWESDLPLRKFKLDKAEKKLVDLDTPWAGDGVAMLAAAGLDPALASPALGTIGGGNHFAELQSIEAIVDAQRFEALGLSADRLWLMVHSGSRGLGQGILDNWMRKGAADGLIADSPEGRAYRTDHDGAMQWAVVNRAIIAQRFCEKLGIDAVRRLDICHNSVTPHCAGHQAGWLHRKGAAPADKGPVVIPGSRGSFSYLVEPLAENADRALHSLAHGAGRKWSRSDAHARLSRRYRAAELDRTPLGSRVICEDKRLIFEEAPEAYKNIGDVIGALETAGLIRVVAILRPLLSYEVRRA